MSLRQRAWAWLRAFLRTGSTMDGLEAWQRTHVPLALAYDGRCAECGKPRAVDTEHCRGRERPWHPPNNATRRCPHAGRYVPGCVVCDPLYNGGYDRSALS